ncbi:MCTP1 [Symbiodinium pilosum]|uniref:MCTP1 protein n=1 Tax=Symbiodinium pilosum TaxID=2952 RepID=A0A812PYS6_SYMPI|nr:MCTP1 [Symbiodinium pilosum]
MDSALFYQHLAGLTQEYERLVQEKADLTKLFSDASSAVLLDEGVLHREEAASIISNKEELEILPPEPQKQVSVSTAKAVYDLDEDVNQLINMAYEIEVSIWKATGLREADIVPGMTSDPYCICSVHGKGKSTFTTPTVANDLSPVWNVSARISDFHYGDSLRFAVMDKDFGKTDDALGEVSLPSEKIIPHGFDEWLVLAGAGAKGVVSSEADISSIKVSVRVIQKFPQEQAKYVEPLVQPAKSASKEASRSPGRTDEETAALKSAETGEESKELAPPQLTRFERWQAFFISEKFELFLAGILCLNILSMAAELQYDGWEIGYLLDYGFYQSSLQDRFAWGNDVLLWVDIGFSVIFTIDVTLRITILQGLFWRGGDIVLGFLCASGELSNKANDLAADPLREAGTRPQGGQAFAVAGVAGISHVLLESQWDSSCLDHVLTCLHPMYRCAFCQQHAPLLLGRCRMGRGGQESCL